MKNTILVAAFSLVIVVVILFATGFIIPSSHIDYFLSIPYGATYEFVEGLSQNQMDELVKHNADYKMDRKGILDTILYNYTNAIEEKYFGGAYWEKAEDRDNSEIHILVTVQRVIPKIEQDGLYFHVVKYSESQLHEFQEKIAFSLVGKWNAIGTKIQENIIIIDVNDETITHGTIDKMIPNDSYILTYNERKVVLCANVTVNNGAEFFAAASPQNT